MKKNAIFSMSGLCLLLTVVFAATAYGVGPYSSNGITVLDNGTGLTWQQSTGDVNNDSQITSDNYPTGDLATWSQALEYCEGLSLNGHNDWRLPNFRELDSIVDLTRYNPSINTDYFFCQSSCYWSATTYAVSTSGAWSICFHNGRGSYNYKTNSHYVRCVRAGLSGSFGQFGSFAFDPIASPVEPDTCIPVRVEAHTAAGALDTGFNGDVSLSINYGWVAPTSIHFSGGLANESCVKVYGVGEHKRLSVQGQGRYGASDYFTSGSSSCWGRVEVHAYTSGATVILNRVEGGEYSREDTNFSHVAAFDHVPCDSYTIKVEKDGHGYEDDKPVNVEFIGATFVRSIHLPETGAKTPVILIPGMMGSTNRGAGGTHPFFKGNYPDKDIAVFLPGPTGWNKLKAQLEDNGHPAIFCPWDWRSESRESMKQNVETFLIPAIDRIKAYTGSDKVDIVAHSMGGLMARAYIQSSLYQNRNDVDRLALVAVPNLGSANPYCLIEAGDTRTTEAMVGGTFYEDTIKKLWKKTYHKHHWKSCKAAKIRDFLHKYGPGVYQLMFTKEFLRHNGDHAVTHGDNVNTWLKAMNAGTNGFAAPADVFSKPDVPGSKVKTRVFAGKLSKQKTLRYIKTGNADGWYPDGIPLDARPISCDLSYTKGPAYNIIQGDGDGTVPWESAVDPVANGWADREQKTKIEWEKTLGFGNHGTIMRSFRDEIQAFLNGGGNSTTSVAAPSGKSLALAKLAKGKAATTTPELIFSVVGDMRLLVTDSQGRKSGIVEATGAVVNEIPETEIEANDQGAGITIRNPAAGEYRLNYYGSSDRDFSLYITSYDTSDESQESEYDGFRPENSQTLLVSYDPAHADQTTEQPVVAAPTEYESTSYNCGAGKCAKLTWKPSAATGVTGYVIYRVPADEPFYTELARVGAGVTSYNTDEPWDNAGGYPVNGYAVSAIKADDTESFFAKEKNYVINKFPWPMFLPAVTGGR